MKLRAVNSAHARWLFRYIFPCKSFREHKYDFLEFLELNNLNAMKMIKLDFYFVSLLCHYSFFEYVETKILKSFSYTYFEDYFLIKNVPEYVPCFDDSDVPSNRINVQCLNIKSTSPRNHFRMRSTKFTCMHSDFWNRQVQLTRKIKLLSVWPSIYTHQT